MLTIALVELQVVGNAVIAGIRHVLCVRVAPVMGHVQLAAIVIVTAHVQHVTHVGVPGHVQIVVDAISHAQTVMNVQIRIIALAQFAEIVRHLETSVRTVARFATKIMAAAIAMRERAGYVGR